MNKDEKINQLNELSRVYDPPPNSMPVIDFSKSEEEIKKQTKACMDMPSQISLKIENRKIVEAKGDPEYLKMMGWKIE